MLMLFVHFKKKFLIEVRFEVEREKEFKPSDSSLNNMNENMLLSFYNILLFVFFSVVGIFFNIESSLCRDKISIIILSLALSLFIMLCIYEESKAASKKWRKKNFPLSSIHHCLYLIHYNHIVYVMHHWNEMNFLSFFLFCWEKKLSRQYPKLIWLFDFLSI